ncbi:hypothetical protein BV22DRAFT_1135188 [Leucogyrophana mollusca]|uniref:Uncharacterized protein n=1 Tax=Leucogyrophana mollusca TaxID=85980 RepID=A0ACB8AXV9_9AGAM|nr:hypothetical protein BV22DRAFT_1135188 [Leucogyrophana mollusca]
MDTNPDPHIYYEYPDAAQIYDEDEATGIEAGAEVQEQHGDVEEVFVGAGGIYGYGSTFMDQFDMDENASLRKENIYYPFASRQDWEIASWLLRSGLSMGAINSFLSLELVSSLNSGPRWVSKVIPTSVATKSPVVLYWRDPLECLQSLFSNPLFQGKIDLTPRRVYTTAQKLRQVYTEWITGDDAWDMQSRLPKGATMLGTILSSDKTTVSAMTGDRVAHPLLIGLANIRMGTRLKLNNNSFMLTALLPVPKFIHSNKRIKGLLEDRLIHECLDIVLEPLKKATELGIMMSDPAGNLCHCFPPLAGYIVDTPEAAMLANVGGGGKTSPFTMAMYKQFGDPFRHEPRTGATTMAQIEVVRSKANPDNLAAYLREAKKLRLCGVDLPFWRDYPLACPSRFFPSEPLHYWHKFFWDHDVRWCLNTMSDEELDFRFSVLQPITGFRHFKGGVSKLKQVTGRAHRDVQRSIVGVIAGAAPAGVVVCVRALSDFRYRAQALRIDDDNLDLISAALQEFHDHKDEIVLAGGRRGKRKKILDNWYIIKLEFMQSVVPSIRRLGAPIQWSADATEHAHVTEIKEPARSSNNNNYDPQICRYLDRMDKCRRFDLATSIRDRLYFEPDEGYSDGEDSDDEHIPDQVRATVKCAGRSRPITDYFNTAKRLRTITPGSVPLPLRTFVVDATAFHLAYDPSIRRISIDELSTKFGLVDLRAALADFLTRDNSLGSSAVHAIRGQRRSSNDTSLPFTDAQVWFKVRLQTTEFHDPLTVLPAQSINCSPPSDPWPLGRYDTVIVNVDKNHTWPKSGLEGHVVAQLRLVIRPLAKDPYVQTWADHFLAYVQRFDIVAQTSGEREATTQMHVLKRATRSSGIRLGDIVPVSQLRAPVNLIPRFVWSRLQNFG